MMLHLDGFKTMVVFLIIFVCFVIVDQGSSVKLKGECSIIVTALFFNLVS